jgi:preprotein translocase subunit SecE
MARLQTKKKTGTKKRKKQTSVGDDQVTVANGSSAQAVALEPKKVKAVSPRKAAAAQRREPGKIMGFVGTAVQFLREVKAELKLVTWPTRKDTIGVTVVVLVLVMIIALFLGVVDIGLSKIIRFVLQ